MTAAYRLKGIGWMAVVVAVALCLYLVSLRVAAERKRVDDIDARIAMAQRDIRALETEFDTRANLAQLERWNGDTLALAAPTPAQFVADDARLASLDPTMVMAPTIHTAALVVPAGAAPVVVSAPAPIVAPAPSPVVAPARPNAVVMTASASPIAPTGRAAPALARLAEAARARIAEAKVRPQAVAMLDRKLLSDTTFGDIMSGARAEARRR